MSSLAARLDEMIVDYTVSGLTVREIATRYGAAAWTIKTMLLGAGVELKRRPPQPAGVRAERGAYKPTDILITDKWEATDRENADREHVAAVVHALGGKGFPFLVFRKAAA